ncbi:MAG: alpha/beta family hydrolase [Bacteroidota bacterium]
MKQEEGRFIAHEEKGEVSSLLYAPEEARALLVLGHGAGACMRHQNMENIALAMAARRVATFRYQFPYMEPGGGRDAVAVSLSTVKAAIRTARERLGELPLLAGGHSFGGRMTSLASVEEDFPAVQGLIFFSFPLHAPGKPTLKRAEHLPDIPFPMLFLSGDRDTFTQRDLYIPLIESLGEKARLHLLETGNHGYKILKRTRTNPEDIFTEMGGVVDDWLSGLGV